MIPTDAHRVCPSTATRADGLSSARRSSSSPARAARRARVLSPSSPISAAALYTNDQTPSLTRTEPDWNSGSKARSATPTVPRVELCVPDEQVEPSRIATTHFQAVDGGQRLLHGVVAGERRLAGVAPGEAGYLDCCSKAVASNRPQGVAECDQRQTLCFDLVGRQRGGLERRLPLCGERFEHVEAGGDRGHGLMAVDERQHAGQTVEHPVDLVHGRRGSAGIGRGGNSGVEQRDELVAARRGPGRETADDADDSAHGYQTKDVRR